MITEKDYGGWSIIREGKQVTAIKTINGSGASQEIILGEGANLMSLFAKYPLFLAKIELLFEDADVKSFKVEKQYLTTASRKNVILNQSGVTVSSGELAGELDVDVFSMPFKLIFTITYTSGKKYDVVVGMMEK